MQKAITTKRALLPPANVCFGSKADVRLSVGMGWKAALEAQPNLTHLAQLFGSVDRGLPDSEFPLTALVRPNLRRSPSDLLTRELRFADWG